MSSRVIRPSTSDFDSIVFVNNTCYNIQDGLSFGLARKVICNNNIFYNNGLSGNTTPYGGILEIDSIGGTANADAARRFDFRKNLFYTEKELTDVMVSTTLFKPGLLNRAARKFLANGQMTIDTITNQSIAFSNPPPSIVGYVKYQWENNNPRSFTPTAAQKLEAIEDLLNVGDVLPPKVQFSFAYATTSPAYTGGLNGDILGDKKWFGLATQIASPVNPANEVNAFFENGSGNLRLIFKKADQASFRIQLYGLDGKMLTNQLIYMPGQTIARVGMPVLSKGIYIYQIESTGVDGQIQLFRGKVIR
jgi:hypothetical protein